MLASLALAEPVRADPQHLLLPLDCTPGLDCWPVRYVDVDPTAHARDHRCGERTEDDHHGTDLAIRDLRAMAEGVEVRAAAAGRVQGIRDGMADIDVDRIGIEALGGLDCGNGLLLDHGDGWTTQYCHLRRGSLRVAKDDRVEAGQPLGLVGLSGNTSFPHLHVEVSLDGRPVDPFRGLGAAPDCAPGVEPLWAPDVRADLSYPPVVLRSAGFAGAPPHEEDIRRGWHLEDELPRTSPALVLWVDGFWVERGDRLTLRATGPDGAVVIEDSRVIEADHSQYYAFAGRERPDGGWRAGRYRGEVTLERKSDSGGPFRASLTREVMLR